MVAISSMPFDHGFHGFYMFLPWNTSAYLQVPKVLHSVFFGLGVTGDLPWNSWVWGKIHWENGGLTLTKMMVWSLNDFIRFNVKFIYCDSNEISNTDQFHKKMHHLSHGFGRFLGLGWCRAKHLCGVVFHGLGCSWGWQSSDMRSLGMGETTKK